LNRYFQDLIHRIQEDESFYLVGPLEDDARLENIVVDDIKDIDLKPAGAEPSVREALVSDLATTQYGIPITINEMVLKSLDFWLNRGREVFVGGLLRSGKYRPIIERVFREESIPLDLMYLAQVESLFKTQAVSKAQAKGLWQFEKETAILYGLKINRDVDERADPEKSTRAAARYLNDLFDIFKDWNLALAAYNWGAGKVQRLIETTGLKDFWQLVDLKQKLPEETKNHVPLIQASVILARNPEKYGLPIKLDPPLQYAEVSVSKPIDLHTAAKVLSTSIDELKKLNPALKGFTTPANYPNFKLKVPANSDPKLHENLASLPAVKIRTAPQYTGRHKVQSGETLTRIAARYQVSVSDLEKANNLSSGKKLAAGMWIRVPSHPSISSKITDLRDAVSSAKSSASTARSTASKKANPDLSKAAKSTVKGKLVEKADSKQTASK